MNNFYVKEHLKKMGLIKLDADGKMRHSRYELS